MHDGSMRAFTDPTEACEFVSEYDTVISSMESFPNRAQMDAFLKSGPKTASTPVKAGQVVTLDDMSPDDKSKFNRIRTLMEDAKPKNTTEFDWKTTKRADKFLVTMRPLSADGKMQWTCKPPLQRVLIGYFSECPTDNTYVNEFFAGLKLAPLRDPNQGPDVILVSKAKNSDREFKCFVMYSIVSIPVEQFTTALQEEQWIKGTLHSVFNAIRVAQRTALFMQIVESAYSPAMYKAMMSETAYGGNFTEYIQHCRIKCIRLENLNKYITKDDANDIKLTLMQAERQHKKYPGNDLYSDQMDVLETPQPATIKVEDTLDAKPEAADKTYKTPSPKKGKKGQTKKKASPKKKPKNTQPDTTIPIDATDDKPITPTDPDIPVNSVIAEVEVKVLADEDATDSEEE